MDDEPTHGHTSGSAEINDPNLRKLEVFLDAVQSQTLVQADDVSVLLVPLFELLDAILATNSTTLSFSERVVQLILTYLQKLYSSVQNVAADALFVNIESVVRSIRNSNNPQTHHIALLLLAQIATIYPDRVLNSIMPIFTFMGVHVVRHDDNYSFHVIQRTIETIIPALVASSRSSKSLDSHVSVASVVGVFVDAFDHIPKHRRLTLFSHLAHTLTPNEHLHIVTALLLKKLVFAKPKATESADAEDSRAVSTADDDAVLQEFILRLTNEFTVLEQASMLSSLLNVLVQLPVAADVDKKQSSKKSSKEPENRVTSFLYSAQDYTPKQLRHLKYRIISYIASHFADRKFLSKVAAGSNKQISSVHVADHLKPVYLSIIETLLAYATELREHLHIAVEQKLAQLDFWQAMLTRVYDVLDRVNSLLAVADFVHVISNLIYSSDFSIRRKAMTLFGNRVTQGVTTSEFNQEEILQLLSVVPEFVKIVQAPGDKMSAAEQLLMQQTTIFSINIMIGTFGTDHQDAFALVADSLCQVLATESQSIKNAELIASALTCLATLVARLGSKTLPSLPAYVPLVLAILESSFTSDKLALVQHGAIAALLVVVKVLPQFLSPFLSRMLVLLTHPTIGSQASSKLKDQQDAIALAAKVREEVPKRVALRILLPAFFEGHHVLLKPSSDLDRDAEQSLVEFLQLFTATIRQMDKKDVPTNYKGIFKFFLAIADYRSTCATAGFNSPLVDQVEACAIQSLIELIMKLSDALFHPLFLKIVDWAVQQDAPVERTVALFKTTNQLANSLKSLFVPYFGHVLKLAMDILTNAASITEALQATDLNQSVKIEVLASLQKLFTYDQEKFLTKERFQGLLPALVEQLKWQEEDDDEAADADSDDESSDEDSHRRKRPARSEAGIKAQRRKKYDARVSAAIPCVAQFCVAAGTAQLRKQLNQAVLMLTRDKSWVVRCTALKAIDECYNRLGDDFLGFLPETVPFIAELLEGTHHVYLCDLHLIVIRFCYLDDNIEVERQCKKLIATMEKYLGESLDKFF
jgi:U3 small nucleolar RNA-associated protein 10